MLLTLDLIGVAVFALSGAALALDKRLDLFGVLVLALVTALGGGILRDVLLGATPPAVLRNQSYLIVAGVAGLVAFIGSRHIHRLSGAVGVFDAAGLGLFAVTGTTKALDAGLGATASVALGCLTGIGGGIARDLLAGVVPTVLRRELYAVPAILGAILVTVGHGLDWSQPPTQVGAAALVFVARMVAVWRDWHLFASPEQPMEPDAHA